MTDVTGRAKEMPCLRRIWTIAARLLLGLPAFAALTGEAVALPPPKGLKPARPPSLARSCTITPTELEPLFASTADPRPQEEEEDGSEDDEEDEDDDSIPGVILPGSATCLSVSGTVSAGLQNDSVRASRSAALPPSSLTSFPTSASLRIATSHELASGLRVGSAFSFTMQNPVNDVAGLTLDEATVLVGPWTFGLDTSRFSFWTGDEFVFSTRAPSRTVGLLAVELPLTETWVATLAMEDPTLGTTSSLPVAAGRVPDGVARLAYQSGAWTLHGALALRDIPGRNSRLGRAGILGATYETEILGRPGSITAQIAGAVDAAPYIGSQLDAAIVRTVLLGSDPTRGFSTALVLRREWTDEIATNFYVSRYQLSVPLIDQAKGKISIDRATANLVWTPVEGLKAGVEASVAQARISLTGRQVAAGLAGRLISTQVFIERAF
ncbi:hypothetical protein [Bosea sp. BIWAKO-01]|uniref:hypothetical protein n=1 Tax=Bosea sp. BIWAKO-01 TaxID=506668 RepID=UPI000852D4A4|nr:hypothetical protein [Bosea sp. BIWAKO-01]GAU84277.1 hypothetical protein BIWAKO_04210 [Bosea sp. BIWAKO-01]